MPRVDLEALLGHEEVYHEPLRYWANGEYSELKLEPHCTETVYSTSAHVQQQNGLLVQRLGSRPTTRFRVLSRGFLRSGLWNQWRLTNALDIVVDRYGNLLQDGWFCDMTDEPVPVRRGEDDAAAQFEVAYLLNRGTAYEPQPDDAMELEAYDDADAAEATEDRRDAPCAPSSKRLRR